MDEVKLHGFMDANWAGNSTDRKSTLGGIFNIRSIVVSWYNKKQRSVALSLVEEECMGVSQATCEAI
jgi:hypothetical protein